MKDDVKKEITNKIANWEWNLERIQYGRNLILEADQIEDEIAFLKRIRRKVKS